jgi:hypothetical protein
MGMSPSHLVTRSAGFFTAFSIPKQDSFCLMQLNGHESRLSAEHKANGGEGAILLPPLPASPDEHYTSRIIRCV